MVNSNSSKPKSKSTRKNVKGKNEKNKKTSKAKPEKTEKTSKVKTEKTEKTSKAKTEKSEKTSKVKTEKSEKISKVKSEKSENIKTKVLKKISVKKNKMSLFGGVGGISSQIKQKFQNSEEYIARFYDDSPDNINDVQKEPTIQCIHVPRVTSGPRGEEDGGTRYEYINYILEHGGWDLKGDDRDLNKVLEFFEENEDYIEESVSDALTEENMKELREWVVQNQQVKCILFDFDRVINRVEGIIGCDTNKELYKLGISPSGLAKYHMGTKERMRTFRRLLNELLRLNIQIHIVTNNTAAGCESFYSILQNIHPVFTKNNVHGSYEYPTKLHCIRDKKLL